MIKRHPRFDSGPQTQAVSCRDSPALRDSSSSSSTVFIINFPALPKLSSSTRDVLRGRSKTRGGLRGKNWAIRGASRSRNGARFYLLRCLPAAGRVPSAEDDVSRKYIASARNALRRPGTRLVVSALLRRKGRQHISSGNVKHRNQPLEAGVFLLDVVNARPRTTLLAELSSRRL